MTEWFISGNPDKYDFINAFDNLGKVDWRQTSNIEVGDVLYLYASADIQRIMYKCKVNKVDLSTLEIDDSKYNLSGEFDGSYGRYMEIEPIEKYDTELFSRLRLQKYGFSSPQGPKRVTFQLKDYLECVQGLLNSKEMDPYKHDGCYELMREIINAYREMNDYSQINYKDLNLVYFSCVGTWSYGFDKKKRDILDSHLAEEQKKHLLEVLDSIQKKANAGEYENREGDKYSIGMFGTGFKSFVGKADDISSKRFIEMCADIISMDEDSTVFNRVEKVINGEFKGMKAASASVILHTLKPYTFPIINGNGSNGNLFIYLGLELKKPGMIETYIDNCRKIKEFRDKYFNVKNYRIYDRAIWNVGQGNHTGVDYLGILEYLEDNANSKYINPSDSSLSSEEKEKYEELKVRAQYAVEQYKKLTDIVFKKFGIKNSETIQWLDGSRSKIRRYMCSRLKYPNHEKEPYSVSIFADIENENQKARFRACLEVENADADENVLKKYHTYFDMSQDEKLQYLAGSDEIGNISLIGDSPDEIKSKVQNGEYKKVQPCIFIYWTDDLTNDLCEEKILNAVENVLPYYKYVIGEDQNEYWPSLDEYYPGITTEKWIEVLNNREITNENNLRMLSMIMDYGLPATCSQLSEKYNCSANYFNKGSSSYAEKVAKYTNCNVLPDKTNENARWWPILYVGRRTKKEETGTYIWKLREELKNALLQIELPKITKDISMSEYEKKRKYSLNTILYGPPGTGKTYNIARIAVEICEPDFDLENKSDDEILDKYKELKKSGRIEFVTFHQSYGYEEFIEGIKPCTDEDNKPGEISYKKVDGIFKAFCRKAGNVEIKSEGLSVEKTNPRVWCLMLDGTGDSELKTYCFKNNEIRIGFSSFPEKITDETEIPSSFTRSMLNYFQEEMRIGDIVVIQKIYDIVDAIGIVTGDYEYEPVAFNGEWARKRSVKWLSTGIAEDIYEVNGKTHLSRPTLYPLDRAKPEEIIKLTEKYGSDEKIVVQKEKKPYVFVIDEINRGNISKIFGELITLIEDSKRSGSKESMEIKLPYTGEVFSVPDNVYIIGTMNTADRSIALMDTALRRRFSFKEMMPKESLFENVNVSKGDITVNVKVLLKTINDRIEFLYDREHTIGHAYFMKLKNEPSLGTLANVFKYSVVPLLQEYFYEDYEKIQLILGDNGKSKEEYKFITGELKAPSDCFVGHTKLEKTMIYKINEKAFDNIESYAELIKPLPVISTDNESDGSTDKE